MKNIFKKTIQLTVTHQILIFHNTFQEKDSATELNWKRKIQKKKKKKKKKKRGLKFFILFFIEIFK